MEWVRYNVFYIRAFCSDVFANLFKMLHTVNTRMWDYVLLVGERVEAAAASN